MVTNVMPKIDQIGQNFAKLHCKGFTPFCQRGMVAKMEG